MQEDTSYEAEYEIKRRIGRMRYLNHLVTTHDIQVENIMQLYASQSKDRRGIIWTSEAFEKLDCERKSKHRVDVFMTRRSVEHRERRIES